MKRLNRTAKLAFFNARRMKSDAASISYLTRTPKNVVFKMLSAKRSISNEVANEAFSITKYRTKNSVMDKILYSAQ